MKQKIYRDERPVWTYDQRSAKVFINIAGPKLWKAITGRDAPECPIDAATYNALGLPWFDVYDDNHEDLVAPEVLSGVQSVAEMQPGLAEEGVCALFLFLREKMLVFVAHGAQQQCCFCPY